MAAENNADQPVTLDECVHSFLAAASIAADRIDIAEPDGPYSGRPYICGVIGGESLAGCGLKGHLDTPAMRSTNSGDTCLLRELHAGMPLLED